jgi:type IV pilus assembly protein PilM
MKSAPGVWGIDLGQCALKALRLQEIDGVLQATAFDYVEYPKILTQPDADPDQLTREALEQFLSRNTLRGDTVSIAVPGQSGLARFVKLPPVEEKKIAEIVKFEAKQQIPFPLEDVVWDFQKLGAGEVVDGFALETEIGLFAMKRDLVARYIQHFKDVNVEVHIIQMAPLALCNYIAYDLLNKDANTPPSSEKGPCVVGLDLGTDSSNLVVTDGGKIIWQRPIPLGGNHFTRALTKELKLTFAKAEHLKRNAAKSGAELKKILGALKPVLNDFVGEVQRSLGYFTNTHRDAQIEYMVGLGNAFRLPGLQRFLAEKLQLEVRKIDTMARLTGDTVISAPIYQENLLSFGVAYGLCLQGMKRAKLITNLLPQELRLERLIRAKKPWAVGAAAMLLLGLGASLYSGYLAERPYLGEQLENSMKSAGGVVTRISAANSAFAAAKDKALKEKESVKSIVAGQGERVNWAKLLTFISSTIPQPDGSNLTPDMKQFYFEARPKPRTGQSVMSGKDAFGELQRRLREGFKPMVPDDGREVDAFPLGIDDLIQVDIESIDCRFHDNLTEFWKTATLNKGEADVRPEEHFKKVQPDGKGWVIELSGYTFHHAGENFVRQTLLSNIARLGIQPVKADAPAGDNPMGNVPPVAPAPVAPAPGGGMMGGIPGQPGAAQPNMDTKEPIINNISHVLLYRVVAKPVADSSAPFEIISAGSLDALTGGGAGGAGGLMGGGERGGSPGGPVMPGAMVGGPVGGVPGAGPVGGMPGAGTTGGTPTADRSAWRPLSSRGGGSGGGAGLLGGMPAGGPRGGTPGAGPIGGVPGMIGGGPGMIGGGPGTGATKGTAKHSRTEFVILFIWKEPTPSDALRGGLEPPPGTTPTGGIPGAPPGGPVGGAPGGR